MTGPKLGGTSPGNPAIEYLGVVGEPRASLRGAGTDIPTLSSVTVVLLAAALALVALLKLN